MQRERERERGGGRDRQTDRQTNNTINDRTDIFAHSQTNKIKIMGPAQY